MNYNNLLEYHIINYNTCIGHKLRVIDASINSFKLVHKHSNRKLGYNFKINLVVSRFNFA